MHISKLTSSTPLFSQLPVSSLLRASASLFPVSQVSYTVQELHLSGSERPSQQKDTLAKSFSRSCRSFGRNSILWRENKSGCITSFLTNHSTKV